MVAGDGLEWVCIALRTAATLSFIFRVADILPISEATLSDATSQLSVENS